MLEMSNTLHLSSDKPELSCGLNTPVSQSFAVRFADSTVTERRKSFAPNLDLALRPNHFNPLAAHIGARTRTSPPRRKFGQI
jgi:hypothetical protein